MAISITDFKNAFSGGTRKNRFVVQGTIPFSQGAVSQFHVAATEIPTLSTQNIEYGYFGRKMYYPGEKQYGTWSMVVYDDTGTNDLWKKFHTWQNSINNHTSNVSTFAPDYKANNWSINHLSLNGEGSPNTYLKTFILDGCWPKTVTPVSLNMGSVNDFCQFTVVLLFDLLRVKSQGAEITDDGA